MPNNNFNLKPDQIRTFYILQLIFDATIALTFLTCLIPFLYTIAFLWVVPLAIASLVFSVLTNNQTRELTIATLVISIIGLIPLLGYFVRIIGIVTVIISISQIASVLGQETEKKDEDVVDVEISVKKDAAKNTKKTVNPDTENKV